MQMKKHVLLAGLIAIAGFVIVRFYDPAPDAPATVEASGGSSRLSELLGSDAAEGYSMATGARAFDFPEDHGPHPDFRNEWWYLTGNLEDQRGRRFGFELTFFRFALSPGPPAATTESSNSNWRTRQVYIAHFAISDKKGEQFFVEQRASRGALGLAGAQTSPFRVWLEYWSIRARQKDVKSARVGELWELNAAGEQISLHLDLSAQKPPVLNGIDGLSQKSAERGNASYYYSITRLHSEGRLQIDDETFEVTGLSWLDREWSSSALSADQQGWDWFALQLSDGSDLMFYNIRSINGNQDEHSAGTWLSANGEVRHLGRKDVAIVVTAEWTSPQGGTYPAAWDIDIPQLDLELSVEPVIDNQELFTTVRYWEGAVDVLGRRNGSPVEGRGYVELTGYAR
jgi:predicted secreted hydrolase